MINEDYLSQQDIDNILSKTFDGHIPSPTELLTEEEVSALIDGIESYNPNIKTSAPIRIVLENTTLTTQDIAQLQLKQVVSLNSLLGTDVQLYAGNQIIAYGEVVKGEDKNLGIHITKFPSK